MIKFCTILALISLSTHSMAASWAVDARINLKQVKTSRSMAKTISDLTREVIEDGADEEGGSYFCSTSSTIRNSYVEGNTFHLTVGFNSYGNLCSENGKENAEHVLEYLKEDVSKVKFGELYDQDQEEK